MGKASSSLLKQTALPQFTNVQFALFFSLGKPLRIDVYTHGSSSPHFSELSEKSLSIILYNLIVIGLSLCKPVISQFETFFLKVILYCTFVILFLLFVCFGFSNYNLNQSFPMALGFTSTPSCLVYHCVYHIHLTL